MNPLEFDHCIMCRLQVASMRARDPRFDDTSGSFDMDGFTCLGLECVQSLIGCV